jgi:transcriptional regulator with XRE-family HTH domain
MAQDPWSSQVEALGRFIHAQRKMAKMSQRELAALSDISNAYLSQLERGLHQPSMRVINQVAKGLGMQPEAFLSQAGMLDVDEAEGETGEATTPPRVSAEEAIRTDPSLTPAQREALLAVYRSFSAG